MKPSRELFELAHELSEAHLVVSQETLLRAFGMPSLSGLLYARDIERLQKALVAIAEAAVMKPKTEKEKTAEQVRRDEMESAYMAGYHAWFFFSIRRDENPFKIHVAENLKWDMGWDDAFKHKSPTPNLSA